MEGLYAGGNGCTMWRLATLRSSSIVLCPEFRIVYTSQSEFQLYNEKQERSGGDILNRSVSFSHTHPLSLQSQFSYLFPFSSVGII